MTFIKQMIMGLLKGFFTTLELFLDSFTKGAGFTFGAIMIFNILKNWGAV